MQTSSNQEGSKVFRVPHSDGADSGLKSRRKFLTKVSKAALAGPPTVALILTAGSRPSEAVPPYHAPAHGWRRKTGKG
jgi:hypothetical protein